MKQLTTLVEGGPLRGGLKSEEVINLAAAELISWNKSVLSLRTVYFDPNGIVP